MNAQAQKVDVLAALDAEIEDISNTSCSDPNEELRIRLRERRLRKTRDAMAELIAATTEHFAASQACVDAQRAGNRESLCEAGGRAYEADKRLVAALARVSGGAK